MSTLDESLRSLLTSLSTCGGPSAERADILGRLVTAAANADGRFVPDESHMSALLSCLDCSDQEESEEAAKVLLLFNVEVLALLQTCRPWLDRLMTSSNENAKVTCAKILSRASTSLTAMTPLLSSEHRRLLEKLVATMKEESLAASKYASELLVASADLRRDSDDRPLLFQEPLKDYLTSVLVEGNARSRIRAYEVVVTVAKKSKEHMQWLLDFDFLSRLLGELYLVDDPLSVAAALEVAVDLAECPWGVQWLEQKNVMAEIDSHLPSIAASDFASLLLPRFIRFLGMVGRHQPFSEFFSAYPNLKLQLQEMMLPQNDLSDRLFALDTVCHLCSSHTARKRGLLRDNNPAMADAFFAVLKLAIVDNPSDTRCHGLTTLTEMIAGSDDGSDLEVLNAEVFAKFAGEQSLALVAKYAQLPFEEVATAAHEVLLRMAGQTWGIKEINRQPGLVEVLLNRNARGAQFKAVMELKHKILSRASDHPRASVVFAPSILEAMSDYVAKGVYYAESRQMEVAMAES